MKKFLLLLVLASLFSCKKNAQTSTPIRNSLIPQIAEAYENNDWNKIILLSDSIIKSGEPFDDMIVPYADALMQTGKAEKAIDILKKDLNCKESPNKKDLIYNSLGSAHMMKKDYENAQMAYRKALEISPSYAHPMINLAKLYSETGDTEQSLYFYTKAASLFFENNYKDGLYEIGMKMYDLDPDNRNTLQVLGKAYNLMGEYDKEELCLLRQMEIIMGGKESLTNENDKDRYCKCMIELAVSQFNQDKIDKCLESIQWLRKSAKKLGAWEEDIQRLEMACKEKLSK